MSPIHSSPGLSPSTSSINSLFLDDLRASRASFTPTRSVDSIDETWDVVEDLPLRWASDYVSLAISGSRLANTSVLFYDIWSDAMTSGRKGALLAVATKSTILLYETPKGERAFRFVKVSYLFPLFFELSAVAHSLVPGTNLSVLFSASVLSLYLVIVAEPNHCSPFFLWAFGLSRSSISLALLEQCDSYINPSATRSREAPLMWGVVRGLHPQNSIRAITGAFLPPLRVYGTQTSSACLCFSKKRPGLSAYPTHQSAKSN